MTDMGPSHIVVESLSDIKYVGDSDMFKLLCRSSSDKKGWLKSTMAMEVYGGCIVQVTSQQINPDGSRSMAEALTFVPQVLISEDINGGNKLIPYPI